ncbi:MAG: hypothetical protein ABH828_04310 [archaeon]
MDSESQIERIDGIIQIHADYPTSEISKEQAVFLMSKIKEYNEPVAIVPYFSKRNVKTMLSLKSSGNYKIFSRHEFVAPSASLKYISDITGKPIEELILGAGGMYGDICVSSFVMRSCEDYSVPENNDGTKGGVDAQIKAKKGIVLPDISFYFPNWANEFQTFLKD